MGDGVKEVLPTTTVTESNRDGLFGRIPRRVLEDARLVKYNRVVHLDVEEKTEELLTPALLCHKEPARASKAPY